MDKSLLLNQSIMRVIAFLSDNVI